MLKMAAAGRSTLQALRQVCSMRLKNKGFENTLSGINVISGSDGGCVCELKVTEDNKNLYGSLHGGLMATLVDAVSTWGMEAHTSNPGISVELNITYVKGAKVGETVVIESKPLKIGRTLAYFSVDITNKKTGDLLATGRHTKHVGR
ncbi:acyl-coenzyme A thioesterase 13-like [Liolophura sinensis]|uniref:acyl-coenzyme A thioesterase 13-like n=1 Tax=Liolophura sinensis TaxID=3198878 RepID=UPI0031583F6E